MKNIHLFETKDAYDATKSGLVLPRVSYIKENKDVKYNPTFDANGHDYVDIAGIKWATMNVGAKSITDYGLYFQWGDTHGWTAEQVTENTEPKKTFSWDDYKFTNDECGIYKKYNETGMTLELVDDAVHAAWGGSWRMPTKGEMQTVLNSTAVTANYTSGYNGTSVAGYVFHDNKSNDTLFFPACGYVDNGNIYYSGVKGFYYLSSIYDDSVANACDFSFNMYNGDVYSNNRYHGLTVRGVLDEN